MLLLAAEETGLKGPVDEFLSYCFEEEDEHGDVSADVDRIFPLVKQEVQVRRPPECGVGFVWAPR